MTFRIAGSALLLFALAAESSAQSKRSHESTPIDAVLRSHGFRRVPMERSEAGFFVRARINNKSGALVIETGSPFTTLDRNSIGDYGLTEALTSVPLNGPMGKTAGKIGLSRTKSIELAKIVLADDAVPVVDLSAMNRRSRVHVAGVLGLSQMWRLGAIIDCGQGTLYLNPRGATGESKANLDGTLTARAFSRVPMRLNRRLLSEVDCQVNGLKHKVAIETASFTTLLEKRIALKAGMRLAETGYNTEGVGKQTAPVSIGIANEFLVGNLGTRNQKLSVIDSKFGVLGIDYLTDHRAVIDFGGMNLYLHH